MPFRKPSIQNPDTGEAGSWKRVQGRHVFVPSTDESAEEIGANEIERWEHPTPSFKGHLTDVDDTREKEKFQSVEDNLNVRNIHADGAKDSEPYIGAPQKEVKMPDKNKVGDVQLNDTIKYYLNGEEGVGKVYAMTGEFFTVRKESGGYQDIQITDIFFVDQILTKGRAWAHMDVNERTEILSKARCPLSFVTRLWEDLPEEVVKVIKSNFENGAYGGVDTSIHFDATEDYESVDINDDKSNFKHDNLESDASTTESEQVPDSAKKPEVENKDGSNRGDAGSGMIAGVKAEEDEKDKAEEQEIANSLSSGGKNTLKPEDKGQQDEAYVGKEEDEVEKENSSMGTGDSGSFNAVHNDRYNSDNNNENHIGKSKKYARKVGIPQANTYSGIGYGVEKLEDE